MEAVHPLTSSGSTRRGSWAWETLDRPKKATLIRVRWPFTIICAYLLLYSECESVSPVAVHGFVLLYLVSNLALYFVDERRFESFYFFASLVAFDTAFFIASLAISGETTADFYVVCFATIFLCCICRDMRGLIGVAVLSPLLYGYFLLPSSNFHEPTLYLRILFPFVISLFYGYFAQVESLQSAIKEQTELAARTAQLYETAKLQAAEKALLLEELQRKTQLLEQANRAKEQFLGIMSHELRTPLSVVMGYARLLKDRVLGDISPMQAEAMAKIMSRAKDQLMMVTDILEVTSIEAGESTVRRQEVSLAGLLADLKSDCELPQGKSIVVTWNYAADLPVVKTDAEKLKHALRNLINNALKFTYRGAVTVSARVEVRDQELGIGNQELGASPSPRPLDPSACFVEFKVADTGIGIPEEHLPHIFDRFHQIDSSNTRVHGGAGIGLYVVKRLAEMLGARIQVTSVPAQGSIFTLILRCEPCGGSARLVKRR